MGHVKEVKNMTATDVNASWTEVYNEIQHRQKAIVSPIVDRLIDVLADILRTKGESP